MFYDFRWNEWNIEKIQRHGLTIEDVEFVVNNARRPFPRPIGNEKWLVVGPTRSGRVIHAIYLAGVGGGLFVIHARPLTPNERRRQRRRR